VLRRGAYGKGSRVTTGNGFEDLELCMLFSNLRVILFSDLIFRLQPSLGPKVSHNLPIDTVGVRLWRRESETVFWPAEVHSA